MAIEFSSISIGPIGEPVTSDKFAWVPVILRFDDAETNAHPSIAIETPIKYDSQWSIDRVRDAAARKAFSILLVAAELVSKHGLKGLEELDQERREKEALEVEQARARIDEVFGPTE